MPYSEEARTKAEFEAMLDAMTTAQFEWPNRLQVAFKRHEVRVIA